MLDQNIYVHLSMSMWCLHLLLEYSLDIIYYILDKVFFTQTTYSMSFTYVHIAAIVEEYLVPQVLHFL